MGWFFELVGEIDRDLAGPRPLAKAMLDNWPKERGKSQPKGGVSSLASQLSKVDREPASRWIRAEWRQRVVEDTVGMRHGSVARRLDDLEVAAPGDALHLDAVPGCVIDLSTAMLPPGLPPELEHPQSWNRLWWFAPSGSGRSLVGQMLEATQRATFVRATTWEAVEKAIRASSESAPVLVELEGALGGPVPESIRKTEANRFCIAAPFLPAALPQPPTSLRDKERAAPPAHWPGQLTMASFDAETVGLLLRWVARGLAGANDPNVTAATSWLRQEVLPVLGIGTLTDALSLVSLYLEYEDRCHGQPLSDLARMYIEQRLLTSREAGPNPPSAEVYERLVQMARKCIARGSAPWSERRTRKEWAALLPAGLTPDLVDEIVHATAAEDPSAAASVRNALTKLLGTPEALVDALVRALVLKATGRSRLYAIQPHWLRETVLSEAVTATLDGGDVDEIGEAALHPEYAESVAAEMVSRVARGDLDVVRTAIDGENAGIAETAVLELSFVAAGLAVLIGMELPSELLDKLWNAEMSLPRPTGRLPGPLLQAPREQQEQTPVLHVGLWYLAALAISEGKEEPTEPAVLQPWLGAEVSYEGSQVLMLAHHGVRALRERGVGEALVSAAYRLGSRLLDARGAAVLLPGFQSPCVLQYPAFLVQRTQLGDLEPEHLRILQDPEFPLDELDIEAAKREVEWAAIARCIWTTWVRSGDSVDRRERLPMEHEWWRDRLFREIPGDAIREGAYKLIDDPRNADLSGFGDEQWQAVLEVISGDLLQLEHYRGPAWIKAMPAKWIRKAVEQRVLNGHPAWSCAAALWTEHPASVVDGLQVLLAKTGFRDEAFMIIHSAPDAHKRTVFDLVHASLQGRTCADQELRSVWSWAQELVTQRVPFWRDAYELMVEAGAAAAQASES